MVNVNTSTTTIEAARIATLGIIDCKIFILFVILLNSKFKVFITGYIVVILNTLPQMSNCLKTINSVL